MLLPRILSQKCILQCNRRADARRGFTLVELIVILVILAILAALLIPALSGYLDKARERALIAETRQAVVAAQSLVSETYALGGAEPTKQQVEALSDTPGVVYSFTRVGGRLDHLGYIHDDLCCTYCSRTKNGQSCDLCGAVQTFTVGTEQSDFYPIAMLSELNSLATIDEGSQFLNKTYKSLNDYFNQNGDQRMDSTAPENDNGYPFARDLKKFLISENHFPATVGSWAIVENKSTYEEGITKLYNYYLYYSSVDISKLKATEGTTVGDTVSVTKYDPNTGQRTTQNVKIAQNTSHKKNIFNLTDF